MNQINISSHEMYNQLSQVTQIDTFSYEMYNQLRKIYSVMKCIINYLKIYLVIEIRNQLS